MKTAGPQLRRRSEWGMGDHGGRAKATAHRGGVIAFGRLRRGLVSHGETEEPCVVAEERDGRHPQVVGHELERPTEEIVRQADGIRHCQHGQVVEFPCLIDQVGGADGHHAFATQLPEGDHRLARGPTGDDMDPGRPQ